jgi:hypothetical protein
MKELRNVAKKNIISLRSVTRKVNVVTLIHKFFCLVSTNQLPILTKKFNALVDKKNRVDIST